MSVHCESAASLLAVDDISQVGAARRAVAALARSLGFGDEAVGRAEIIATELATNLVRHAQDGRMLLRVDHHNAAEPALEILAIDAGPGIASIERCLRDGYSSGGTAGNGLGAIRRLANDFDMASQPGSGTVVLSRIRNAPGGGERAAMPVAAVCLPMPGERACGDGWAWQPAAAGGSLLVFDGLGHGELAAEAAHEACTAFAELPDLAPADAVMGLHRRLSGTRGGAAAVARIDIAAGTLSYAGVGNIAGAILGHEQRRGLPSHNGIAGSIVGTIRSFEYPWAEGDLLVMHSDGLQSRWNLDDAPGLATRDPAVVAAQLYRKFNRGRDDVTVAVVRG
jgi:anti-sigma regulatory factor (Ser/Thr protein kinase)